jgi:hypothetical protein
MACPSLSDGYSSQSVWQGLPDWPPPPVSWLYRRHRTLGSGKNRPQRRYSLCRGIQACTWPSAPSVTGTSRPRRSMPAWGRKRCGGRSAVAVTGPEPATLQSRTACESCAWPVGSHRPAAPRRRCPSARSVRRLVGRPLPAAAFRLDPFPDLDHHLQGHG